MTLDPVALFEQVGGADWQRDLELGGFAVIAFIVIAIVMLGAARWLERR